MSGDEEPLVSILTPVYNGEEHLIECIESALAQTYSRWEYIIVNNHSKDGSEAIARKYAAHDERIRVLSNNSLLPPVTNFNHALRQISPESRYCKMLFADDWLYPRCIEQMVALAEKDHAISIIGSLALEGTRVRWFGLPCDQSIFSGEQVCREHFLQNVYAFGAATACLYRADLVRSREDFFNPLNVHSDMEICFDLLRCSKFGFVHQVLSFSRPRPDSLSSQSTSLGSDYLGMIYHLMKYGRDYLSKQELENCLAQAWSDYYRFLGKNLLLHRDHEFWQFHRHQLFLMRAHLSWLRVVEGAPLAIMGAVYNRLNHTFANKFYSSVAS